MAQEDYQPSYPDYPADYVPNVVEIRDERGILARIENMKLVENAERPEGFEPQIISWLFDGSEAENIAYAHTANTVLINRIGSLKALTQLSATLEGE